VEKNLKAPARDNEWFTEEIIVEGKHIVTKVNGRTIVDYTEPDGVARRSPKLDKGMFALQAHDPGSTVRYRSISVKRLGEPVNAAKDSELNNFPDQFR